MLPEDDRYLSTDPAVRADYWHQRALKLEKAIRLMVAMADMEPGAKDPVPFSVRSLLD